MTGEQERELLEVLSELRRQFPDLRLGQLVCTLTILARDDEPESVWDVEDQELLTAARRMLSERQGKAVAAHHAD